MYRGRLWTMRQYAGYGTAAESNARYRYLLSQGVGGLSVAFDLPTQMGYDSDHPMAGGRSGTRRRRRRFDRRHGGALRRHPARSGLDVDDHQRDGHHSARALRRACPRAERGARAPVGNHPERHPEGIRRAGNVHLSSTCVVAPRHRHVRLVRAGTSRLEHDLDQRVSHPRGRLDGDPGSRIHAGERIDLRRGRAVGRSGPQPPWTASVLLLCGAQRHHRGNCEVPGGAPALGHAHARSASA